MKLYFETNERLKKIFNYFSIFTIVLGTTFGSLNSAFAVDTSYDGSSAGETVITDTAITGTLAVLAGDDLTITGGTVTVAVDVGSDEISDIVLSNDTAAALTINNAGAIAIASTLDVANTKVGTLNVQFATAENAPSLVTYSGAVSSTGTSTIAVGSSTTAGNIKFTSTSDLVADTITITGGDHADEDSTLDATDGVTTTSITLDDNTGVAKLLLSVT